MRHLRTLLDLSADEVQEILSLAIELKQGLSRGERPGLFQNHSVTLLFEKPSLRTRNSFEVAAGQLGGQCWFYSADEAGMNGRETLEDIARVIGSYADVLAMRTFSQSLIDTFVQYADCHVINALSDERHPCQALTDALTMKELFGDITGRKLVYIGDGNNVAASLATVAAQCDFRLTLASPPGYSLPDTVRDSIVAQYPKAAIECVDDPRSAVVDADVIYTDVWASMGQESESDIRKKAFADYQVNAMLMQCAPSSCRFMHDLPARRGLEVTSEVIEGDQSAVFQQAENRMHLAKALLVWLIRSR